jgi:hypothetical protein
MIIEMTQLTLQKDDNIINPIDFRKDEGEKNAKKVSNSFKSNYDNSCKLD